MTNIGIVPLDPNTPVGALRLIVGDTASTPLDPPVADQGSYAIWSDDALSAALSAAGDNAYRAAGALYLALASEYIQQGRSVKTDDLAIDTRTRGTDLLKVAQSFLAQADADDAAGASDFFQIVPFGGRPGRQRVRPEATPYPNC